MVFDIAYVLALFSLLIAAIAVVSCFCRLFELIKKSCQRIIDIIIVNRTIAEINLNESLDAARETLLSEIIKTLPMEDMPND